MCTSHYSTQDRTHTHVHGHTHAHTHSQLHDHGKWFNPWCAFTVHPTQGLFAPPLIKSYHLCIPCKHTQTLLLSPTSLLPPPLPSIILSYPFASFHPESLLSYCTVEGNETVQGYHLGNRDQRSLASISIFFTVCKCHVCVPMHSAYVHNSIHMYVRMLHASTTYVCTHICYLLCSVVYSVELTVKILALGPHSFFTKAWNVWVRLEEFGVRLAEIVHTQETVMSKVGLIAGICMWDLLQVWCWCGGYCTIVKPFEWTTCWPPSSCIPQTTVNATSGEASRLSFHLLIPPMYCYSHVHITQAKYTVCMCAWATQMSVFTDITAGSCIHTCWTYVPACTYRRTATAILVKILANAGCCVWRDGTGMWWNTLVVLVPHAAKVRGMGGWGVSARCEYVPTSYTRML